MHRESKTAKWLSEQLNQSRQLVARKLKDNDFNSFDKYRIAELGFKS